MPVMSAFFTSRTSSGDRPPVRLIPRHRLGEPFLEPDARLPAELGERPGRVEHSARLAVRLRRVPGDLALEPAQAGHERHEVADPDLEARAQVHGVALPVALGRGDDALRGVARVEKLAGGRPVAPDDDPPVAALPRLDALADERRDDVARLEVEVVPWAVEVHR